jgi:hypothetical protein
LSLDALEGTESPDNSPVFHWSAEKNHQFFTRFFTRFFTSHNFNKFTGNSHTNSQRHSHQDFGEWPHSNNPPFPPESAPRSGPHSGLHSGPHSGPHCVAPGMAPCGRVDQAGTLRHASNGIIRANTHEHPCARANVCVTIPVKRLCEWRVQIWVRTGCLFGARNGARNEARNKAQNGAREGARNCARK